MRGRFFKLSKTPDNDRTVTDVPSPRPRQYRCFTWTVSDLIAAGKQGFQIHSRKKSVKPPVSYSLQLQVFTHALFHSLIHPSGALFGTYVQFHSLSFCVKWASRVACRLAEALDGISNGIPRMDSVADSGSWALPAFPAKPARPASFASKRNTRIMPPCSIIGNGGW